MHSRKTLSAVVLFGLVILFLGCASEQITSARLYIREENWEKAEEVLLKAMELEPENSEVYFHLGNEIYGRKEQWDKMNEMFDKAVSLGPDKKLPSGETVKEAVDNALRQYWGDYYNKGADYYNLAVNASGEEREKNLQIAIEAFETAKVIQPDEPGTYKTLVFAYVLAGKSDMVESTLEQALERNPEDATLLLTAGNMFRDRGELDRAIEFLEKATSIDPRNSQIARSLADCYYDKGDKEGAIFAYKKAIRADPENLDLYFNLGVLYLQVEDFDFAEEQFQKVLRLNPEDRDALVGIGEAYEQMEQWEDAEFYYQKALRLNPDSVILLRAMARVVYRQGRMEEAEGYLNKSKNVKR